MERTWREKIEGTTDQILAQIKRLIDEGNIRRVVVKQQGRVDRRVPADRRRRRHGLAPVAAAIGALTAVLAECSIEVEKTSPPAAAAPEAARRDRGRAGGRAAGGLVRIAGARVADADHTRRHGTPIARISVRGSLARYGENLVHWADLKLPVRPTRFTLRRSSKRHEPKRPLSFHLGVRHRGPPRQDRRPDFRCRPRRDPRPGPHGAGRLRDARDDRPRHHRRRDHHQLHVRLPEGRPRHDHRRRLHQVRVRLRRRHLRGAVLDPRPVARHRDGRRSGRRRRPGPDVRLCLHGRPTS